MDSDFERQEYHRNHFHEDHIQSPEFQQRRQLLSCSGVTPYRSAPSSCISSFLDIPATNYPGEGRRRADFQEQPGPLSPETETIFADFMSSIGGGGRGGTTRNDDRSCGEEPESFPVDQSEWFTSRSVKLEMSEPIQQERCNLNGSCDEMMWSSEQPAWTIQDMGDGRGSEGQMKKKMCANYNNILVRQRSSPAGLYNDEINNGKGLLLPPSQNPKLGGQNMDIRDDGLQGDEEFGTGYPRILINSSRDRCRSRLQSEGESRDDADDDDESKKMFSAEPRSSASDQNQVDGEGRRLLPPLALARRLSLPLDKMLQWDDTVPCKVRAKRGCATHPRSIAERVRRNKISTRMRRLQGVVPNMDKQTNTSDMLDLAVDYIKDLQKKVQTLGENRAKCTCLC